MKKKIRIVPSGLELVDKTWGGFYMGGSYMIIGPRKSGRTLLGLQYALESAKNKEVCLYFTTMRPKDLMIHAASIDLDLQSLMNQNLIIVVRVAPPTDIDPNNPDPYLIEYLNDIITVVEQYMPSRIIFDELTHFIGFNDVNLLQETFVETIETIEDKNITSLFVVGEPANPFAQSIVDAVSQNCTGIISLQKNTNPESRIQGGKLTIIPNIGHTEGQFSTNYFIEPYKGITIDFDQPAAVAPSYGGGQAMNDYNSFGKSPTNMNVPAFNTTPMSPTITNGGSGKKYISLANIEVSAEQPQISNFYDLNDFNLILNNQIALYKSTGQVFTVISFKLENGAEQNGIMNFAQLQNIIRLSTEKKDKICVYKNKILVLVAKDEEKGLSALVSRLRANLPGNDPNYLQKIIQYISVVSYQINDSVQSADDIINYLLEEDKSGHHNGY